MSFECYTYRLPLRNTLKSSRITISERKGCILSFSAEGATFFGDAAPLPGFSPETLDQVSSLLATYTTLLHDVFSSAHPADKLKVLYKKHQFPASLQFGLDSLAYQLQAHRSGTTLQHYLFNEPNKRFAVNATISAYSSSVMQEVQNHLARGIGTLKIKIGSDFNHDFNIIKKIRSNYPAVKIRVDANQSWVLKEALINCQKLESLNIEYCEEPLRDAIPENFEKLYHHTALALALDESVIQNKSWPELLPFTACTVLKPMFLGSYSNIFETKRLADTHDNKIVFTSAFESGVGRTLTGILTSGLGTTTLAHGVDTGILLKKDVLYDGRCQWGMFHLDEQENLISLDQKQLNEVSTRLLKHP